jgi:hypothetical protein
VNEALAHEIRERFSTPEYRAKVEIKQDRHVALQSRTRMHEVMEWLLQKGL